MQHDFILLDRSGSMEANGKWAEALAAVNAYVKKLADDDVDTGVTLAVFDSMHTVDFEVIRDRITPKTWRPVSNDDAKPRGWTPLNDSVIRLVSLARSGKYDKVAIIIVTDGMENASKEDRDGSVARRMLDECRKKGWAVIMLGADMDVRQHTMQAGTYNNDVNATMSAAGGQMVNSMRAVAGKRWAYAQPTARAATMDWSDEEKAELGKKD
jgi:uncharacterized protein with von Willebrand factor type A (vWA) domain